MVIIRYTATVIWQNNRLPSRGGSPRPVGCWHRKKSRLPSTRPNGRGRLNIHGAIDLETGQIRMIDVLTVDAMSTIALLVAIGAM